MWSFELDASDVSFDGENDPALSLRAVRIALNGPLAVLGRNGAGKTTFLRMLAGILGNGDQGAIWNGGNATPRLGYLPAAFGLIPELSVAENLAAHCGDLNSGALIEHAVSMMALGPLLKKRPAGLSLGEGQRVRFAIAISRSPDVYLLDEPVSNMDIDATILAINAMREVANSGKGVVLVTHDLATVESLCPNLLILERGKVLYQGSRERFITMNGVSGFAEAYRLFMGTDHVLDPH